MDKILENIMTRRSIRSFQDKQIGKEALDQIVKAAIYAPSGRGCQSWHFTVIRNKDKMKELAKTIAKKLNKDENTYNFYNPDVLIMASNDKDNVNGLADCSCALENIFLMAHELGIGSVWINQLRGICDEPEIRPILKEFGIPEQHVVWGMAALGYPAEAPAVKERKEGTVHYIL